ncbi:MAG: hypothetical protein DRI36_03460 [Caldiserica bacterium]|nr:MAG: hypothetical protein DRI36_03460 [Caldisericota bacterium]
MTKSRKKRLEMGLLTVGEIAKVCRVLPSTIKYYTSLGLLNYVTRTPGGYRLYDRDETLRRVEEIRKLTQRPNLSMLKEVII